MSAKACKEVFKQFHDSAMGGHSGINKTHDAISRRYYWPSMTADIKTWVYILYIPHYAYQTGLYKEW